MSELKGAKIHITGTVQGVGFRPFVYGAASRLKLNGWVRNTSAGVDIEVDGSQTELNEFIDALKNEIPPLAQIDTFQIQYTNPNGFTSFEIIHSEPIPGAFIPISPDVSICDDCLDELFDPADKRYLYPFINCTNCGPRFTIIEDIPYDRPNTTMATFKMCSFCQSQYEDPLNRRFHAQPVACPQCGPHVWLENSSYISTNSSEPQEPIYADEAIQKSQQMLSDGKILAIKGLGGFHLACDATNPISVSELRNRKLRVDKPFALMMPDIETVEQHCFISQSERDLLKSRQRPIVLLERKPDSAIAPGIAPGQKSLGVMLPYTPLHYLLFTDYPSGNSNTRTPSALVMTSGNLSEEPIAIHNDEARQRLAALADAYLMHNRDIHIRCDDSVIRNISWQSKDVLGKTLENHNIPFSIRRSRGYAPTPMKLPWRANQILATGPELKNTFCITKGNYAFLSQHIGDMENYETLQSLENGISHYEKLFRLQPEAIAYDLHPNYLATRYALDRSQRENLPAIGVQHHHAHIAACMADNGLNDEPIIGVSFDGTGYGDDGAIWGGEFLIAGYQEYQRFAHLEYAPLPGGDMAIRKPFRIALAQLWSQQMPWEPDLPAVTAACRDEMSLLHSMLEHQINTPQTSSIGRLFDSIAALCGVRFEVNYEAQAAIELENLVDSQEEGLYHIPLEKDILRIGPLLTEVINDLRYYVSISIISAKFHNGLAQAVLEVCQTARDQHNLSRIALSGGVWQNTTLLKKTIPLLEKSGFIVYIHSQVPSNDGGVAFGQAVIANHKST
jgi:hydrogenase maturation protein HypF